MAQANIAVRPLTPLIGAEIDGVDLSRPLEEAVIQDLTDALHRHLVIFFRDQNITPEQQVAFARRFGAVEPPHPVFDRVLECPEVTVIEQKGERGIYNDEWHTDVTFRPEPAMASILHCKVSPAVGGDTLWANMYTAYDMLSEPMKRLVEGLRAVHDITEGFGDIVTSGTEGLERLRAMQEKFPPVTHPVVRTHPVTGRKSLFVNRSFTTRILGVSKIESEHLLAMLLRHAEQSNFQVRFRWQPNAIAMWDNRCTQHYAANDFSPQHRRMHRVTVLGDRPFGSEGRAHRS